LWIKAGKTVELLLYGLPYGLRINQQTLGWVGSDNQMTGAKGYERLTVSCRHGESTLVIQTDRYPAAKHCPLSLLYGGKPQKIVSHFYPLLPTVVKKKAKVKEENEGL
jgi:hypothetical protein